MVILDTENDEDRGCPDSHPDEVIISVWSGIRKMCDCLERQSKREYYRDIKCDKGGENS